MCHANLELKFGPKLNFIIGHNGSGKSAILTAITVALGGRAVATSRGSSVKALIRDGASHADVILKIHNIGEMAFKPDDYGSTIIIERRIRRDGGNSYALKSAQGKVVSTKRSELDAICLQFNIQVDNPMNVLTQDTAQKFLANSSDEDKYALFLRGTQLTQLATDYEHVQESLDLTKARLEREKAALPDVKSRYEDVKRKVQESRLAMDSAQQIQELKNKLAWAKVSAVERDIAKHQQGIEQKKEKAVGYERKAQEKQAQVDESTARYEELKKLNDAVEQQISPYNDELNELSDKIKQGRARLIGLKSQSDDMNREVKRYETDIAKFQEHIDLQTTRLNADHREEHDRIIAEIDALSRQVTQAETNREQCEADDRAISQQMQELTQSIAQAESEHRECEHAVGQIEHNIRQLNQQRGDSLRTFGPRVPDLVRAIESSQHQFHETPIGPFGKYVRVRDSRWQPILDTILGKQMSNFAVKNEHDKRLLLDIMTRLGIKDITVVVAQDERYDFSAGEPHEQYLTILRALDISNEYVKRRLIDGNRIEAIILTETWNEAHEIMDTGHRPTNVNGCFTMDGKQVGGARGARTDNLRMYTGAPRFIVDVGQRITFENQNLGRAREQVGRAAEKIRDLNSELDNSRQRQTILRREIPALKKEYRQATTRIQSLRDELQAQQPADVAALTQEVEDTQARLDNVLEQFTSLQEEAKSVGSSQLPYVQRKEEIIKQLEIIRVEYDKRKDDIAKVVSDRVHPQKAYEHWNAKLIDLREEIASEGEKIKQMEDSLAADIQLAEQICDRVEVLQSPERLEKEIQQKEKVLADNARRQGMSLEELLKTLQEQKTIYQNARRDLKEISVFIEAQESTLLSRYERWEEFRKYIAQRSSYWFQWYMLERGFAGRLEFNHERRGGRGRLGLAVTVAGNQTKVAKAPERTRKGKEGEKDPKSLSGGEKSFSTICLLLALWEAMGCPIRCLDEFDVYMDAANRGIAIRMLVRFSTTRRFF